MIADLAYTFDGPKDAPILVLLNSLGTSGDVWQWQLGPLAEQFRVLRIDTRGHGRSAPSPHSQTTIDDLGRDVLAVLDKLGLGRVNIAGISLGGMTAIWLAIHHPDRIRRLALLCTSAHPGNTTSWNARASTVRAAGMAAILDAVVPGWITPALAKRDPALIQFLRDQLASPDAESYAQCCDLLSNLDLRDDLERITAPTLIIAAAGDRALPLEHQQRIAAAIAGSRLEVVEPAAHIPLVEQAGVVSSLLLEHFRGGATLAAGFATRRAVLGDAHVDAAIAKTSPLTEDFQEFITRYAWGDVWTRPDLSHRDRSIATLAALVSLGAEGEIAMHVRAAMHNGLTPDEIAEVLLHTAVYAGLPRANRAFAIAQQTLTDLDNAEEP